MCDLIWKWVNTEVIKFRHTQTAIVLESKYNDKHQKEMKM